MSAKYYEIIGVICIVFRVAEFDEFDLYSYMICLGSFQLQRQIIFKLYRCSIEGPGLKESFEHVNFYCDADYGCLSVKLFFCKDIEVEIYGIYRIT